MSITLWGRLNSSNVQKAVWALEELGLAYDHVCRWAAHSAVSTILPIEP
ncbi:MAG TPA: hypothetical protein VHB23_06070 [Devosiaceae bacterium]|nr:hypothetical protein [Devosiaceae bacterium]